MKKNFTLEDIEIFLKEFGLEWVDRQMRDTTNNHYKKVKTNCFNGKPLFLCLRNKTTNNLSLVLAEISNTTFIISIDRCKLVASDAWQEYLSMKAEQALIV